MEYRVLARKYRPSTFADLIGQEVLVQTLGNAFAGGRVAHAFVLTGIRGVGKTTTARIIARAFNCIGPDGSGGPTISPCGVCSNCVMIAEDRHPDVLEMDAASRTGVGDIRDLIETVRYAPTTARTKVYIIDEVHMLSTSAFNALLKTLEEPPPHVKFIFATTEARKIPVTILSRCQRFDLKRVSSEALAAHLERICEKEGMRAQADALRVIATAAEGSVRDSLSMLDQAMANTPAGEEITGERARAMLGLTDRTQSFELLREVLSGEINQALARFANLTDAGADGLQVLNDMLTSLHFTTRVFLTKEALADPAFSEAEKTHAAALAAEASMPILSRLWQLLMKGVGEVKFASLQTQAAEMVLIRAAYASELPTPEDALKKMQSTPAITAPVTPPAEQQRPSPPVLVKSSEPLAQVADFPAMVALFEVRREAILASRLKQFARLVSFTQGEVQMNFGSYASRDMAKKMGEQLSEWTGSPWRVVFTTEGSDVPLAQQEEEAHKQKLAEAKANPALASLMQAFPGAELVDVN